MYLTMHLLCWHTKFWVTNIMAMLLVGACWSDSRRKASMLGDKTIAVELMSQHGTIV